MSAATSMELQTEPEDAVASLIARVSEQDRLAFRQLYDMTSKRIYSILLRILHRPDLADETLQDVYLTVWSKAKMFDPERCEGLAWLTTVARYRAISRLRQVRRESRGVPRDPTANMGAASLPMDQSLSWTLRKCLEGLPEKQREAIHLTINHGLTHEELAMRLGIPLGTAKARARRALLAMRGCMEEGCA